jgi:uncharacterized protein (TIGR03437 family)
MISAADLASGYVAPLEIVSLIGIGIGPEDPVVYELTGDGKLPTVLGGVQVFFDQTPAHLLLASENRINAIAPADFADESKVSVTVAYQGETTNAVTARVVPSNPAAFFLNPAQSVPPFDESILNANGGLNRSPDPAIRREIIQIFLAGGGTLDPAQEAGSITPITPPYPRFAVPVRVFRRITATSRQSTSWRWFMPAPRRASRPGAFRSTRASRLT